MLKNIFLIFSLFAAAYGSGQLSMVKWPPSLSFSGTNEINCNYIEPLVAACMGYSVSQPINFDGAEIVNPFKTPETAVIIQIDAPAKYFENLGIQKYPIVGSDCNPWEELPYTLEAHNLTAIDIDSSDIMDRPERFEPHYGVLKIKPDAIKTTLKSNGDQKLAIEDIAVIAALANAAKLPAYTKINLRLRLPNPESYVEFSRLLGSELSKFGTTDNTKNVLVAVIISESSQTNTESHNRARRAATNEEEDINLAKSYSEDYPIIFNIILWFSVVLAFSLLAISYAIATMDPGRDSIIYRMTSTRIKKDL